MTSEDMVSVDLGDDYYLGSYFNEFDAGGEYEIPSAQLERWKEAHAAWEAAQDEIAEVMAAQRDKVMAARKESSGPLSDAIHVAYDSLFRQVLSAGPLPQDPIRKGRGA